MRGAWSAGPGDDQARFLADLRALRDSAAIGYDELAARAHYPSDVLKEAENGPSLPGLPVLTAYVRACEGDVPDWEERWRRLNPRVYDDAGLPVRPAGASAAAVAGARAGVGFAAPDVYDPERIKAALRGDHMRSEQAGRRVGDLGISASAPGAGQDAPADAVTQSGAGRGAGSRWDAAADPGITSANGNHSAERANRGPFDAVFTSISDAAESSEPAQAEKFSWLKKSTPPSRTAEPTDSSFAWLEPTDTTRASQRKAEPAPPEPAVTERIPPQQADGLAAQERTDFWSKPVPTPAADLQRPAAPRAGETAIPRAVRPGHDDTATTPAAESAHRPGSESTSAAPPVAAAAQSLGSTRSAARATASKQDGRRQDGLFPARLLVVVVIAALIGSLLVLLLR
jgi:hypothetical protein